MTNPPKTPEDALKKQVVDEVIRIFKLSHDRSSEPKQVNAILTALIICYAYIHTPSDVARYKNALDLTSPSLKEKLYPTDYLTIEALRVFEPEIYAYIRSEYPWSKRLVNNLFGASWMQEWSSFWVGLQTTTFKAADEEGMADMRGLILGYTFPPDISNVRALLRAKKIAMPAHFRSYSRCLSALGIK